MSVVVVDTNVPIAANGGNEVTPECVLACQAALVEVLDDRRRLALDDDWRIISEYRHMLRASGAPGLGDRFLKWVLTNWNNPQRIDLVPITAQDEAAGEFEEFPEGEGLTRFDPSDRKFVAVAHAHAEKPPILQGLDSKWWGWKDALRAAGIEVVFLCRSEVAATYERKFGAKDPPARKARRG